MITIPFYKRLGFKIAAVYFIGFLIVSVGGWRLSVTIAGNMFERILDQRFTASESSVEAHVAFLQQMTGIWARHIAGEPELQSRLMRKDMRGIEAFLDEQKKSITADALLLLDGKGTILYRGQDKEDKGEPMGHVRMVQDILSGAPIASGILTEKNNFILYSAAPVIAAGGNRNPPGILLVGYLINDNFLANIKRSTGMDVMVVRRQAIMATTLRDGGAIPDTLPLPYLDYQSIIDKQSGHDAMTLFGVDCYVKAWSLSRMDGDTPGSVLLAYPRNLFDQQIASLSRQYLIVFTAAFILLLALSGRTISGFLSSVRALANKTRVIAAEGDFSPIPVATDDEIGQLTGNFNHMAVSLREKREAIRQYQETLENRVAERTAELHQANIELRRAKDTAEEAALLRDKFVSLVSHDLKNPLSTVQGFLTLLHFEHDRIGKDDAKAMIAGALDSSNNMLHLIDDLLEISRIKTGQLRPNSSVTDLHFIAVKAVMAYAAFAADKRIEIRNEVPPKTTIYADEQLLLGVLKNLLSNAVKFCREGGLIKLYLAEPATIVVEDTGIGIAPSLLPNLFKYEVKTSTPGTRGETGTGLGLPLCCDILKAHGGDLRVESEVGKGSAFYIILPPHGSRRGDNGDK